MAPDIVAEQNSRKTEPYRSKQRFQHSPVPRNMKKESERLKTFVNWTVSFLDSKKLAKNGFYYTNTDDTVKCVFCDVQIGCWEEGDVPEADHQRLSSNCPFLRGQDCGNIILSEVGEESEENKEEEEVMSQNVCGYYGLKIRPFSAPERLGKTPFSTEAVHLWRDFEKLGVLKISGPVSPNYATLGARIKMFKNWPIPEIQSPEKLAQAGFYYISFHDNVLCFHCGGGLRNWEIGDDPWVEHARWFSRCGYVILRKGREFVNEVLAKEDQSQFAALTVKGLANECRSNTEISQEEEEEEEEEHMKEQNIPTQTQTFAAPSISSTSNSDEENKLSRFFPNSDGKEIELCRICYVRERGIVFLPCGHFVSCTQCAPSLSTCAVCRKPFEATVRAYLS